MQHNFTYVTFKPPKQDTLSDTNGAILSENRGKPHVTIWQVVKFATGVFKVGKDGKPASSGRLKAIG